MTAFISTVTASATPSKPVSLSHSAASIALSCGTTHGRWRGAVDRSSYKVCDSQATRRKFCRSRLAAIVGFGYKPLIFIFLESQNKQK